MIEEAYVSFEVAKLLKEKGFNEKCRGGYHSEFDDNDSPIVMLEEWMAQPYNNEFVDEGFLCSAPTHQMAMTWLREEKGIAIIPILSSICDNEKFFWHIKVVVAKNHKTYQQGWVYEQFENAIEAALKYTLENLI